MQLFCDQIVHIVEILFGYNEIGKQRNHYNRDYKYQFNSHVLGIMAKEKDCFVL